MGKPGFPIPRLWGVPAAPNRGWETGKPAFPIPLPLGGASRSHQRLGNGETRFPHSLSLCRCAAQPHGWLR